MARILFAIISLTLMLYFMGFASADVSPMKRKESVGRRVQRLERTLENTKNQLDAVLHKFKTELGRFSDDPACPNNLPGFYHNAALGSCYRLENSSLLLNWTEAKLHCQRLHADAHLVAIETEEEQQYLATRWRNERGIGGVSRFWSSGKRMSGKWRWGATGLVVKPYSHWLPLTEHNDDRFGCIAILSNEAYFWTDIACWAPCMVTCEIRL